METSHANKTHFHKKGSHLSVSRAGAAKHNFNLGCGGGGGGGGGRGGGGEGGGVGGGPDE